MPNVRLNERNLTDLPAPTDRAQLYYWDTELVGFGVVVGRTGTKTFVARAWVNRKNRRVKIGSAGRARPDGHTWTVALARLEAKKLLGKMSEGLDPNAEARARTRTKSVKADPLEPEPAADEPDDTSKPSPAGGAPSLRDGYHAHLNRMKKRNRSQQTIATFTKEVEKYLAPWLDRPIADLDGVELGKIHEQIKQNAKPRVGTNPRNERGAPLANRVVAHVSACWSSLNKKLMGKLGTWNPAKSVDKDLLTAKRERIADADLPDWYARVQTMRNPIQRDGLIFALFTGLRSEDVRTTRHERVNVTERSLELPDPKGGESRAFKIPLCKTALQIVRRRKTENAESPLLLAGDGGYVFPGPNAAGEIGPICDLRQRVHDGPKHSRFPIEDVHTLRRTYESVAHEVGISDLDLHVLTNHSFASHNVNATYIAQALPHLARCQDAIEAGLWKRIRGSATRRVRKPKRQQAVQ